MQATTDIDFREVGEMGNALLQKLNLLREEEPIAWNDSLNSWIITRHEDVMAGFSSDLPLSCVRMEGRSFGDMTPEQIMARWPKSIATLPHWIVNSDPPLHGRLRSLMTKAFSRKFAESIRPFAQQTIAEVLDNVSGRVDVVEQVARAITGRVILHIFGLPEKYHDRLKAWSYAFNVGLGGVRPALDAVEATIVEMEGVFRAEIEKRRQAPQGDFISLLVSAQDGKDQLSLEEVLGICYLVIVAGHDTTLNTMSLGVAALIENPDARQYLVSHPDEINNSIMEVMRYISMSTAFNRFASADFEWRGQQIKKGDQVFMMTAGANRDPRVFDNPEQMDLTRETDRVTTFGPGVHHCIGHLLAKMQLSEFYPAFFKRFPDAQLIDAELDFQPVLSFRGLNKLRVDLGEKAL
jgi:cytochrome P450